MTDPHFDRVLRAAARRGRPGEPCPEPAQLAAYVDRSLSASEREVIEHHIADCAACMERLALLAAVDAPEESTVPAITWNPARILKHLGWLAPVATAVLVAAVWFRTPAPAPPVDVLRQQGKEEARAPSVERDVRPRSEAPSIESAPAAPSVEQPRGRAKTQAFDAVAGSAKKAPEAPVESRQHQSPAPQAEDKIARRDADASDEREGARLQAAESQARAMADAAAAPAAPPAPATPKAAEPANRPDAGVAGNVMAKALTASLIVAGPDQMRVRLDGQRLERSVDGGGSWSLERQGVHDALSAGACPTSQVCWLVGSDASWIRDASGVWTRHAIPAGARVTVVAATDALHAVVTRVDGSHLATADGGVTWTAALGP